MSMHALTRRSLSKAELERILAGKGLDEHAIAAEVERLERVGLIDDVALAHDVAQRLRERKGLGRTAIAAELSRRALPADAVAQALGELDADDELPAALELAARRALQLRGLDRATAERRLSGFLMRRGYSGGIVREAVGAALGESRGGVSFD